MSTSRSAPSRSPGGGVVLLALVASSLVGSSLGGCVFPTATPHWSDQLSAEGPCWRVDILDGLDESSTDELHDLFDCVNRQGAVAPLGASVDALDSTGRTGTPIGIELARLVNDLPDIDVDVFAFAGAALRLLDDEDRPLEPLLELAVELVYGDAYGAVLAADGVGTQEDLDRGLLAPLLPVLSELSGTLLDQGDAAPALLAEVLDDDVVADMACTVAGLAHTSDSDAAALGADLVPNLGDALLRAADSSNDRWSEASGNSLRDLLDAGLLQLGEDGQSAVVALRPDLLELVEDPLVVANLEVTIGAARDSGRLALLPAQLRYLAIVDGGGSSLSDDEDSALASLLRLLHDGDTEVSCSLDLWVTDLTIELGNLSVALLGVLADQDPETVADGVDVLGDVLGWGLTEATLDAVAESGVCPAIDAQLVSDLAAVDRLNDDEVGDLLVVLLSVLDDARDGQEDRLEAVVGLASGLHSRGLVRPLEEALVDLGGAGFAVDLTEVISLLLDPSALQVEACPSGSRPLDFDGLLGLLGAALADRTGGVPLDIFTPLLTAALGDDGTWVALDNLGRLASDEAAVTQDLLPLLAALMRADPELSLVGDVGPILADPALHGPALRILEQPALTSAMGAPDQTTVRGPLPWLAGLVTGGTLDSVLRTVDLVLELLGGASDGAASSATDDSTPSPTP